MIYYFNQRPALYRHRSRPELRPYRQRCPNLLSRVIPDPGMPPFPDRTVPPHPRLVSTSGGETRDTDRRVGLPLRQSCRH